MHVPENHVLDGVNRPVQRRCGLTSNYFDHLLLLLLFLYLLLLLLPLNVLN